MWNELMDELMSSVSVDSVGNLKRSEMIGHPCRSTVVPLSTLNYPPVLSC